MPAKKNPLPLHVSRALIAREQANVVLRTQRRIALLRANENAMHNGPDDHPVTVTVHTHTHNHYCLSIFCFCVLLVILNLPFLQWLFYKVRNVNAK